MRIITEGLERSTVLCKGPWFVSPVPTSGSSQEPEAVPGSLYPLVAFVDTCMHVYTYRQVTTLMDMNENLKGHY